jgi:hypothetical protein
LACLPLPLEGECDVDASGLKEGDDRSLHGGIPGEVGGKTMPVGDEYYGGTDSMNPENRTYTKKLSTASSPTDSTYKLNLMDKINGETKILSGKVRTSQRRLRKLRKRRQAMCERGCVLSGLSSSSPSSRK